jgi:hypothetical protein
MVARCSYAQAVRAMFPDGRRNSYYSFWSDIRRALDVLGVRYGERARRCATWERIPETAIVGCGGLPGIFWHWVVYDPARRTVYDPLRFAPVSSSRIRRKPFSYLAVQPPA